MQENPSRLPTPPAEKSSDPTTAAARDLSFEARRQRSSVSNLDAAKITPDNPGYCAKALAQVVRTMQGF